MYNQTTPFMRITTILPLLVAILLTGCRNNEEQTTENPPIEHKEAVHPGHVGEEDDIVLDNGDQWEVNRETTEGVEEFSQLLQNSTASSVEEYRELGNRLKEEKNNLASTTVPGQSYSQSLETYLSRLEEKISQLQEVDSAEEGERITSEIQKVLSSYPDYFRSE